MTTLTNTVDPLIGQDLKNVFKLNFYKTINNENENENKATNSKIMKFDKRENIIKLLKGHDDHGFNRNQVYRLKKKNYVIINNKLHAPSENENETGIYLPIICQEEFFDVLYQIYI